MYKNLVSPQSTVNAFIYVQNGSGSHDACFKLVIESTCKQVYIEVWVSMQNLLKSYFTQHPFMFIF